MSEPSTSSASWIVVDASAFAAVLFDEPGGAEMAAKWSKKRIVAPHLLRFELANVLLTKARKAPDRMDPWLRAYEIFLQSDIEYCQLTFIDVLALARRRNLTAYDASYAWLAFSRNIELVTLDRKLLSAFEAERTACS